MAEENSSFGNVAKIPFNICKGVNPSGIPKVDFIEDVESFLKQDNATVDAILKVLQELFSKYKYYETVTIRNKASIKGKVPEIEEALNAIRFIKKKKEAGEGAKTNFCLCDNVYTEAKIDAENDRVGLWLGANVMLEYTYADAEALLQKQLDQALVKIESIDRDLDFLKDQITTTEVSIARVYNYDVKVRREIAQKA